MKHKKSIIFGLLAIVGGIVAYCSTTTSHNTQTQRGYSTSIANTNDNSNALAHINWLRQYPQLASIESNNQTAVIDKLRTSESISELIGPINNPYGVRDDILAEIIKLVPESNERMLQAAIKDAYYYNLTYYVSSNEEKLTYIRKSGTALHCLIIFDKSNNRTQAYKASQMFDNMMRNTENRSTYLRDIDYRVFGWQTLGEITDETDKICEKGTY